MPKPIKDPRSPYYQYDFKRAKRRFHGTTRCTTERKAQAFINRLIERIADGDIGKEDITVNDACLAYWNDKGQHERSSKTTAYQLENLCSILGKSRPLAAITLRDFRAYTAKRRASVSNASVNREWQLARRVWKHVESDYVVAPIEWGKLALGEPKERVRELKADEERRLFEALPDSLKPIVEFAILSGQRKSAIVALRWDKIDWANGETTIVNKGGDNHTFPLTPALIQLLLEQPVVDDCPFVFICLRASRAKAQGPPCPAQRTPLRIQQAGLGPQVAQGQVRRWRDRLPLPRSAPHAGHQVHALDGQHQGGRQTAWAHRYSHHKPLRARRDGRPAKCHGCIGVTE